MTASDRRELYASRAADTYVFSHVPDGSAPIDPDGVFHRFQRQAAASASDAGCATCGTSWSPSWSPGGVDWRTISGRAGHADGHMTLATYAHFQQAQDRQAAGVMESLLAPAATPDARR
jgi:integrase